MMHPGYQNPQYLGPSGPVDNELSVLVVRSPDGRPIGMLANYSMHYFGATAVTRPKACPEVFIGGQSDNIANFEGRICDVAVHGG